MQNRGMFPYRRQGPKKRKSGQARNKMRGPQKGLPNSARDLLPLLQPATKALAQMLAGRTQASGQLGHAQTMLAQAERLIAERAHNRLNPAEREEFFEQLARLKLTLADADAEAETRAAEEQVVKPPARQVAQERLKEMALALRSPEAADRPAEEQAATNGGARSGFEAHVPPPDRDQRNSDERNGEGVDEERTPADEPKHVSTDRAGRLHLPRFAAEAAANVVATGGVEAGVRRRARRAKESLAAADDRRADRPEAGARKAEQPVGQSAEADASDAGEEASRSTTARRPRKPKSKGLPEGWVIDEEGYVVPGPG